MKLIALFFTLLSYTAFSQDSSWIKKEVNEILSLNIPSNFKTSQVSYLQEYSGEVNDNVYLFRYYDTAMKVENEEDFKISLVGYVQGMLQDSSIASYKITINDTSIGRTTGLFVKLNARDSKLTFNQIYFYATMANNHFYAFNVLSKSIIENDPKINLFFQSILFDPKKVKESSYSLTFRFEN